MTTWASMSISKRSRTSPESSKHNHKIPSALADETAQKMNFLKTLGEYVMLMGKVFSRPEKARIYYRRTMFEMEALGFNSIVITAIISIFIGAVITIQMAINLESPFIPPMMIGYTTRETMVFEHRFRDRYNAYYRAD